MITSDGLEGLGFKPFIDFMLRDDGDGVYISEWNPSQPQPSVADIEAAEQVYIAEAIAKEEAREAIRQSMITKLASTLTPEETAFLEELL
jgi:hypothetical protein